jgi:L-2,4-diaminobutyric acid acetyltransferase
LSTNTCCNNYSINMRLHLGISDLFPDKPCPDDFADSAIVTTRAPRSEDAAAITELVRSTGTLETNTTYAYLLLANHFQETCVVAECGDQLAGCVLAYRKPQSPETLVIWQIGTSPPHQRRGIARRLLRALSERPSLSAITRIETTIAPSNQASRQLFQWWAQELNAVFRITGELSPSLFGTEEHEREDICSIGPFQFGEAPT